MQIVEKKLTFFYLRSYKYRKILGHSIRLTNYEKQNKHLAFHTVLDLKNEKRIKK